MSIIGLQQSQTEVGRIRLGVLVKSANGRSRPAKLDRFRFTSPRRALIERIAELYGGKVEPWQPPRGGAQWQVISNAVEVPVVVPPQDPSESQWYEMWSAGGCLRRCDGQTEKITKSACLCDPEQRACNIHTRLRVMLEDVPGLGAWRVDTGSYYAATELPGVASLLAMAQGAIPGRLVLDQRTVTRQVNGAAKTFNFAVPTLHVDEITPAQLMSGQVQRLIAARRAAAIEATELRQLAARSDFASLVAAARTIEALTELFERARKEGVADELGTLFSERAAAIRSSAAEAAPAKAEPEVIEAQLVEPGDEIDRVWSEILAASRWDGAEELERHFCEVVGCSSDEAGVEDMRRFLASLQREAQASGVSDAAT